MSHCPSLIFSFWFFFHLYGVQIVVTTSRISFDFVTFLKIVEQSSLRIKQALNWNMSTRWPKHQVLVCLLLFGCILLRQSASSIFWLEHFHVSVIQSASCYISHCVVARVSYISVLDAKTTSRRIDFSCPCIFYEKFLQVIQVYNFVALLLFASTAITSSI
jgi:hypothetical protein